MQLFIQILLALLVPLGSLLLLFIIGCIAALYAADKESKKKC